MSIRVLGVDPGLTRLGFGVVEEQGGALTALASGTIRTPADRSVPFRLRELADAVNEVVGRFKPDAVALERVYLKLNAKSAVPAIQAAGVTMAAAAAAGAEVAEFSASQVKLSVVGSGSASKDQVRFMVKALVGGSPEFDSPDAADAIAIAICYLNSRRMRQIEVLA